jgi:hypothetical protein
MKARIFFIIPIQKSHPAGVRDVPVSAEPTLKQA